jgi:hypothetical protein
MKITNVETYPVFTTRTWLFVTVETDEGLWGASPT